MDFKQLHIRKAEKEDISLLLDLIKGLAKYEKRPQDMTGTKEQLTYWLFERKIAEALIAEYDGNAVGYALYYPIFGSFSAIGKVHLEDIYIKEEFRGCGFGKYFLANVAKSVLAEGYTEMEWSCLDWNTSAIGFYEKLGAEQETGRVYFGFPKSELESIAALC
ncbi:hypothetical protein M9Y10_037519 [Tritrichomonas musculus]|uniref:N-acetyltransferase domain-containing protein n=1 Tax=Tritrichomonas musculus TaxID=1915356 RepID=A0ABR2GTQ0_9EUKA